MAGDQAKGGYSSCYSDQATHLVNQLQSFNQDIHQSNNPSEIYNLTTSMEMWKGFIGGGKSGSNHHGPDSGLPASSKDAAAINQPTTSDFYQNNWHSDEPNRFLEDENDDNDPSNLRSCAFPCEANERPSQGLSLSLSSNNPSTIGLQSFELRNHHQQQDHDQMGRFFIGSKPMINIQHEQDLIQDGFLGKAANLQYHQADGQFQIRGSKYLGPAQELLNEFCDLGTNRQSHDQLHESKLKLHKSTQWEQEEENIGPSSSKHSLYSLEFLDLQKRKTKLLQMLEEVDRRYKHYCDQMKDVVSSFEAVAGNGATTVYSALASKAMSRHFRCLRDGIVGQIKATKKAMGEKDTAAPGHTRGETPRLKVLDQTLRQQRAFQQMNMMGSHPWRPQRGLPERSVSVLRAWLFEHFLHPYPSDVDKHILARQTGLSRSQVSNWFINARVRLWKPMVEEMYVEETKEHDNVGSSDGATNVDDDQNGGRQINQNPQTHNQDDQKPTPDQLVRIDSECLSSIFNNPERNDTKQPQNYSFGRIADPFGGIEIDFSSYNGAGGVSYSTNEQNVQQIFNGSGGGVSLTLGLQQHGGGGVSLAFSPTSHQSSIFYPRDHIEECQQVQYSILDSDQGQNLPYRNLMGAQLLHDLAG